jgi:DNA polymerase sigma
VRQAHHLNILLFLLNFVGGLCSHFFDEENLGSLGVLFEEFFRA